MSQDGRLICHFCGLHIVYGGVSVQTWLQSSLVFVFIYEGHSVAWPEVGALWCVCVGQKDMWSSCEGQTSSRLPGAASLLSITRTQSRSRVSSSKGGTVVQVRDGGGLHIGVRVVELTRGDWFQDAHVVTALTQTALSSPAPWRNTDSWCLQPLPGTRFPSPFSTPTCATQALLPDMLLFILL